MLTKDEMMKNFGSSKLEHLGVEVDARHRAHLTIGWVRRVEGDEFRDHSHERGEARKGVYLPEGKEKVSPREEDGVPPKEPVKFEYIPISSISSVHVL